MKIISKISELRNYLSKKKEVACVPTMGNIHKGHMSLVDIAKQTGATVVTTIFVNPLQFGTNSDFEKYPRTFEEDCRRLSSVGNDIVFHPNQDEMYAKPQSYFIDPPKVAKKLEGRFRPSHFRGVCTVVLKLFNIVQPTIAIFGKKDYQQLAVIRDMTENLAFPIKIIPAETVRDSSGLALSSRNRFLSISEEKIANDLYKAMLVIKETIKSGDKNFVAMEYNAGAYLAIRGWVVDYVVVRTQRGLNRPSDKSCELVVLGAATLGKTRLIDNLEVNI